MLVVVFCCLWVCGVRFVVVCLLFVVRVLVVRWVSVVRCVLFVGYCSLCVVR